MKQFLQHRKIGSMGITYLWSVLPRGYFISTGAARTEHADNPGSALFEKGFSDR